MLNKEDYQRVVEISHELNAILKRSALDALELHIKDGLPQLPQQPMLVMHGKNYQRVTDWVQNTHEEEEGYEELLSKSKGIIC